MTRFLLRKNLVYIFFVCCYFLLFVEKCKLRKNFWGQIHSSFTCFIRSEKSRNSLYFSKFVFLIKMEKNNNLIFFNHRLTFQATSLECYLILSRSYANIFCGPPTRNVNRLNYRYRFPLSILCLKILGQGIPRSWYLSVLIRVRIHFQDF